jgi:hypothetical protein
MGPGGGHFLGAERRAVGGLRALLVGRTESDHGAGADQRRPGGFRAGRVDGLLDLHRVVPVNTADDLPAVGFEARRRVVGEPAFDVAVDRNSIVVPEGDQFAETETAGQRTGLVRYALHHAAVAEEHPGVMIDHLVPTPVEPVCQNLFRQRHADGVRDTLPQRAGRGLHPRGFSVLGMPGRLRVQLPEILQFRHRQVVTGQVKE